MEGPGRAGGDTLAATDAAVAQDGASAPSGKRGGRAGVGAAPAFDLRKAVGEAGRRHDLKRGAGAKRVGAGHGLRDGHKLEVPAHPTPNGGAAGG